jgi:CspA family cold shock protein
MLLTIPNSRLILEHGLHLPEIRLYSLGYQSQIDGLWRFAAPLSFYLAAFSTRNPTFGLRNRRNIDMPIGTVKFFNDAKGYGFIQPDTGDGDAFVHISAVERAGLQTLRQDQRLSFDMEQDRRGKMSAVNLKVEDQTAPQAQ